MACRRIPFFTCTSPFNIFHLCSRPIKRNCRQLEPQRRLVNGIFGTRRCESPIGRFSAIMRKMRTGFHLSIHIIILVLVGHCSAKLEHNALYPRNAITWNRSFVSTPSGDCGTCLNRRNGNAGYKVTTSTRVKCLVVEADDRWMDGCVRCMVLPVRSFLHLWKTRFVRGFSRFEGASKTSHDGKQSEKCSPTMSRANICLLWLHFSQTHIAKTI